MNPTSDPSRTATAPRRTSWPSTATMVLFTGIVAGISYLDGLFLIRYAGADGFEAYFYPLIPDGLILISSLRRNRRGEPRTAWSLSGIVLGVAMTLAMNIGAGILHNWVYALADGCVPVVFFVALKNFEAAPERGRGGEALPSAPAAQDQTGPDTADQETEADQDGPPPAPPTPDEALLVLIKSGSRQEIADLLGVPKTRVNRWNARLTAPVQDDAERSGEEPPEVAGDDGAAADVDQFEPGLTRFAFANGSGPGA